MENWLIEIMSAYGYVGIMFLIALENIFPPIPSEVILTFGGFIITDKKTPSDLCYGQSPTIQVRMNCRQPIGRRFVRNFPIMV